VVGYSQCFVVNVVGVLVVIVIVMVVMVMVIVTVIVMVIVIVMVVVVMGDGDGGDGSSGSGSGDGDGDGYDGYGGKWRGSALGEWWKVLVLALPVRYLRGSLLGGYDGSVVVETVEVPHG
jgi:hypothetical protein